jgi:hypothetical protein
VKGAALQPKLTVGKLFTDLDFGDVERVAKRNLAEDKNNKTLCPGGGQGDAGVVGREVVAYCGVKDKDLRCGRLKGFVLFGPAVAGCRR